MILGADKRHQVDVVVVGGGILGLHVADIASQKGLSVALVERSTLCSNASGNSLRIIHGGFRYLQRLDIRRFRQSQAELARLQHRFPVAIDPLPCVLPLDGRQFRKPAIARIAQAAVPEPTITRPTKRRVPAMITDNSSTSVSASRKRRLSSISCSRAPTANRSTLGSRECPCSCSGGM